MKQFSLSFYDVFGYLFPGAILLFSSYIMFLPYLASFESNLRYFTITKLVVLLAVAYLAGHMAQALANFRTPYLGVLKLVLINLVMTNDIKVVP